MSVDLPDDARLLVINVARIGDTLLATPLLRALKAARPGGELSCIAHPKRAEVLRGLPFLDRLLPMSKRSAVWRGHLPGRRHDLVVVLGHDLPMLRYALRVGRRVVAFRQAAPDIDAALAASVPPPAGDCHAVEERALLLAPLRLPLAGRRLAYAVSGEEAAWAADWLAARGLGGRLVGLQASSFHTKPYRDWPAAHFRELARRLLAEYPDAAILLFGDRGDRARAEAIAAGEARIHVVAGEFGLRRSAAVMARLALYVGVDTGPTHLAGALGLPMVALYHCRHPGRLLAPLDHPAYLAVIEHPRAAEGGTEADSMAEIGVDTVWAAVQAGLA